MCIPTLAMCDAISYDEEARNFRNEDMRKTKDAARRSRTPSQKLKKSAMFAGTESGREARPSNLGCYHCAEFGRARRECTVDPAKLRCTTCKVSGHVTNVCPEIYTWLEYARSRSASLNRSLRQSADEAKTRAPIP